MSFFDDTKNAGLLLLIIALMDIIFAIISVFVMDGYKDAEMWKKIVLLIGGVIEGVILAIVGLGIKNGSCMIQIGGFFSDVTSKFGVLVAGTAALGIGMIISGIFGTIAFGANNVFDIVIGILIVLVAYLMLDGGKIANNVIWIILLIVYILGIIVSLIACLVLVGIPSLLLFIMLLLFLLSPEVKSKMGM